MEDAITTIFKRHSIRDYTDQPVADEQLYVILRAAMAAPSAKNMQPWHFVVIKERDTLNRLMKALPYAKMLEKAPLAIAICGDTENSQGVAPDSWVMDCSAATENLLLAAQALNLGAVWTGVHPYPDRVEPVQKVLELPVSVVPLNVIVIGYPLTKGQAKDKWKPEKIHLESW